MNHTDEIKRLRDEADLLERWEQFKANSMEEISSLRAKLAVSQEHMTTATDVIAEMEDKLAAAEEDKARLLRLDQPWALDHVVEKLCEATGHLLDDHNCDVQGHEQFRTVQIIGMDIVAQLRSARQTGEQAP